MEENLPKERQPNESFGFSAVSFLVRDKKQQCAICSASGIQALSGDVFENTVSQTFPVLIFLTFFPLSLFKISLSLSFWSREDILLCARSCFNLFRTLVDNMIWETLYDWPVRLRSLPMTGKIFHSGEQPKTGGHWADGFQALKHHHRSSFVKQFTLCFAFTYFSRSWQVLHSPSPQQAVNNVMTSTIFSSNAVLAFNAPVGTTWNLKKKNNKAFLVRLLVSFSTAEGFCRKSFSLARAK